MHHFQLKCFGSVLETLGMWESSVRLAEQIRGFKFACRFALNSIAVSIPTHFGVLAKTDSYQLWQPWLAPCLPKLTITKIISLLCLLKLTMATSNFGTTMAPAWRCPCSCPTWFDFSHHLTTWDGGCAWLWNGSHQCMKFLALLLRY